MADNRQQLHPMSVAVLEMIAAGNTYEQILSAHPDLTYLNIFGAAREALDAFNLDANSPSAAKPSYQVADVRKSYPRAYEKWTDAEERNLRDFVGRGLTVAQIAIRLQRQRSAIRSRIVRLDLVGKMSDEEQSELARISKLDPVNPDPSVDPADNQ